MSNQTGALEQILLSSIGDDPAAALGIAVSGGGDSLALLHVAHSLRKKTGVVIAAVTVDHGLRSGSDDEAAGVARICASLNIEHQTLLWGAYSGQGNLQDQARRARYSLIADWAKAQGIGRVALGHTADDQAETVLMRLARGAGVDGLSAMEQARQSQGILWLRPFLGVHRNVLRSYLRALNQGWIDDPSNEDTRFERIKARQLLSTLAPIGIDTDTLCGLATRMTDVRIALDAQTLEAARRIARVDQGDVVFERAGFDAQPAEIQRRLLSHALKWVSSAEYGPRGPALGGLLENLRNGHKSTLHGCVLISNDETLRVLREANAVEHVTVPAGEVWDRRWLVNGFENRGLTVRSLGEEGLLLCPDWRDTGLPRASQLAAPSVWQGTTLIAAPLAGVGNGWRAELASGEEHFFTSLLSH